MRRPTSIVIAQTTPRPPAADSTETDQRRSGAGVMDLDAPDQGGDADDPQPPVDGPTIELGATSLRDHNGSPPSCGDCARGDGATDDTDTPPANQDRKYQATWRYTTDCAD